jgi:hypothetical protein
MKMNYSHTNMFEDPPLAFPLFAETPGDPPPDEEPPPEGDPPPESNPPLQGDPPPDGTPPVTDPSG